MKSLGKIVKIAQLEGKPWKQVLQQFLRTYRATPHATTGYSPNQLMFGRNISSRLPNIDIPDRSQIVLEAIANSEKSNDKNRNYADKKLHTKPSNLKIGDTALVKQPKINKLTPRYNPEELEIISIEGSRVKGRDQYGKEIDRNISFFKRMPLQPDTAPETIDTTEINAETDEQTDSQEQQSPLTFGPRQPEQRKTPVTSKHSAKKASSEKKKLHRASKKDVNYRDKYRKYDKNAPAQHLAFDSESESTSTTTLPI